MPAPSEETDAPAQGLPDLAFLKVPVVDAAFQVCCTPLHPSLPCHIAAKFILVLVESISADVSVPAGGGQTATDIYSFGKDKSSIIPGLAGNPPTFPPSQCSFHFVPIQRPMRMDNNWLCGWPGAVVKGAVAFDVL